MSLKTPRARRATPEDLELPPLPDMESGLAKEYRRDFKKFFRERLAQNVKNKRTGMAHADSLGRIHDFLIDFMNLNETDVVTYSPLQTFLPTRNEDGVFNERWMYWRTLDSKPEIQDGPVGPISKMYREEFWQGVVVRIKGDGLYKCVLIPRGHLKSTLLTQGMTVWNIIREPDSRTLIRSLTGDNAAAFMSDVKFHFESNDRFRELFAGFGPPAKREGTWRTDQIQVYNPALGKFKSRGKENTLRSCGMETEITGVHCDRVVLDDVVGESNYRGVEGRNAKTKIRRMQNIPDPGSPLVDIGTPWEKDDVHSLFLADDDIGEDTSFIVATCLDGDHVCPASKKLTPLGYGKPIWPEGFSMQDLLKRRRAMETTRDWFSQMFCQFHGTGMCTFSREWVQRYEGVPEKVAREKNLNIFVFFDTASGKSEQSGRLDFTAGIVLGQTPDRRGIYLLDGFKEKLPAELIARGMHALAHKWHQIAGKYGATFFAGVEENAYTSFLHPLLQAVMREAGASKFLSIQQVSHKNIEKVERIRALAMPYSDRRVHWPHELFIAPIGPNQEPYCLVKVLEYEYCGWPGLPNEDLMDAHAGAVNQMVPLDFKLEPQDLILKGGPDVYRRQIQDEESDQVGLSGYEREGRWSQL